MNALYCEADGQVFDPDGRLSRSEKRRVRFVGDPVARIGEDYLRILRFFRFHARYGKGKPDAQGLAACMRMKDGLSRPLRRAHPPGDDEAAGGAARAHDACCHARQRHPGEVLPEAEDFALFKRMAAIDAAQKARA